jgi:hypothetical protein
VVPKVGQPEIDDSGTSAVPQNSKALLHEASLKTETREVSARPVAALPQATAKSTDKPATAAKPAPRKSVEKPSLAAAQAVRRAAPKELASTFGQHAKKTVDKPQFLTAKAVTKPVRLAKVDPLAPLPARHSGHSKDVSAD